MHDRHTRSSSNNNLAIPKCHTEYYKHALCYSGSVLMERTTSRNMTKTFSSFFQNNVEAISPYSCFQWIVVILNFDFICLVNTIIYIILPCIFNLLYYLVQVNYMYLYFAVISYADVYSIGLLVNLLTLCICLFIVIQCTFIMIVNCFYPRGPIGNQLLLNGLPW